MFFAGAYYTKMLSDTAKVRVVVTNTNLYSTNNTATSGQKILEGSSSGWKKYSAKPEVMERRCAELKYMGELMNDKGGVTSPCLMIFWNMIIYMLW